MDDDDAQKIYEILSNLSSELNTDLSKSILIDLDKVFDNYHLSYSDSYSMARVLMEDVESREYVYENVKTLCRQNNDGNARNKSDIGKLLDYLTLECSRFTDFNLMVNQIVKTQTNEGKFISITRKIDGLSDKIDAEDLKMIKQIDSVEKKMQEQIIPVVSVLSIFAAIVISFSGGFTLLGNALSAAKQINAFRLVFIVALIGLILFDVIIMLMFIVCRINNRDIGVQCKKNILKGNCNNCSFRKDNSLYLIYCQGINKYPYIVISNVLFLSIMLCIFIVWTVSTFIGEKYWVYDIIIGIVIIILIDLIYFRLIKHT
jgi:hypothetical protein